MPFILVSGEIGEDTAVEAMRNGASDYLLKNNLARLVPALMHAVEATETRRARERADRELGESKQRLRELAQHLQTSIEQERAAIAREIHDDVGGSLTALKFDLAWIARHATRRRGAPAREFGARDGDAGDRVEPAHHAQPAPGHPGAGPGGGAAVDRRALREAHRHRLRAARCRRRRPSWPAGVPLVAYRTAQEALTNITKHAQATRVQIDLSLAGGVLSLEISDNGRGLSQRGPGQGPLLRHPRAARARRHGGRLGRPVQRPGRHHADTVGAAVNPIGDTSPAPAHPLREPEDPSQWGTL